MNINIEDYLSEDEIKVIIKEQFKYKVKEAIEYNGTSRYIANMGYQMVFEIMNEEIPEFEKQVKEQIKKVIDDLTSFSVFRKADMVNREDSLGQKYLEEAVTDNKEIINNKVVEIFKELSLSDLSYDIKDILEEKIDNLFLSKNKKDEE